MNFYYSALKNN